ncbi:MAG TPA: universal stress protein [Usitatibacter sp.]|nr:universal stress protein [Usitatibacter sp.]
MYKRILLAYDGSESGQKALLESREVAQWSNSEIRLVAVMPPPAAYVGAEGGVYDAGYEKQERERYEAVLAEGLQRLVDAGHNAKGEVVVGEPVAEISRYAAEIAADLIVVGHRHLDSWAQRWWRGSVSKAIIEHAPCNVLVVITR